MNPTISSDKPLLITNPTNIRYLTGFVGVEKRDAYLLLLKNKKYLFTSSLYLEVAKKLRDIEIIEISKDKPFEKALVRLNLSPLQGSTFKGVEFEETDLTVAEYNRFKKYVRLIPTKNRIEELRMIKRKDEIENIRAAAKRTDQCFDYILGKLKPGVTEIEMAWEIQHFLGDIAFSPIVAFNAHSSMPHYMTGSDPVRLRGSSLVLLDFGARVNGYCADMTRVVFLGKPKPEWIKTYNRVFAANNKALELLKNGERNGGVLDKKANIPPYPHSLGHAVGLDIHEAPRLTHKKPEMLKPDMVFTIEPGIYIEGQYGIRIEDLVLLKKDGIEILSHSQKTPIMI